MDLEDSPVTLADPADCREYTAYEPSFDIDLDDNGGASGRVSVRVACDVSDEVSCTRPSSTPT